MTIVLKIQTVALTFASYGILGKIGKGECSRECDTIVVVVDPKDLAAARSLAETHCGLENTYVEVRT